MLRQLERLTVLARGGRWNRLRFAPWRYLYGQCFQKIIYPFYRRGIPANIRTFWGTEMSIVLPAAMDVFLLGGKTHDSELRLTKFMIRHLSPGDEMADIGAHYGFFSLLAAYLTGPNGRVEAFEASSDTFEMLQRNLHTIPQTKAHHLAINDCNGHLDFYEFPTLYAEYNTMRPAQFAGQKWYKKHPPEVHQVPAMTLDTFCEQYAFQPAFLKIDVEGAEDKVIAGMLKFLSVHRPVIIMEYLAESRLNEAHQLAASKLRKWGFSSQRIKADGHLESCSDIEAYLQQSGLDSDNIVFT